LHALRHRIRDFQTAHAAALAGQDELNLFRATPGCRKAESST
jgi:hypothetical protein